MIPILQVEGVFPDGTKLVTVHDPIRLAEGAFPENVVGIPGEIRAAEGRIEINAGRPKASLTVLNTGDRPVQIGSHFHFFETNKALDFDRASAFGMRLDIPAGTAVRFEPGQSREIDLVRIGGTAHVGGLNGLTSGATGAADREAALIKARAAGFKGA